MIPDLEKSILKTISFFSLFDYPLTAEEIRRWLFSCPEKFSEQEVNSSIIKGKLTTENFQKNLLTRNGSFYFLGSDQTAFKKRRERYLIAVQKYHKFLKIAKILSFVPFVRMIAISDGLSYNNSQEDDDIDLLVVTEKKRIWLTRFFLILILKFFRARPTPLKKKDKICLSFLVTEGALDFKKIMLEEKDGYPDTYFIYWLSWLYPVYQEKEIWQSFLEKNKWLKEYLPFWFPQESIWRRRVVLNKLTLGIKKTLEKVCNEIFGHWLESFLRWYQIKIMPRQLKEMANHGTSVIINEEILKFHDKDKREKYREKFINKVSKLFI